MTHRQKIGRLRALLEVVVSETEERTSAVPALLLLAVIVAAVTGMMWLGARSTEQAAQERIEEAAREAAEMERLNKEVEAAAKEADAIREADGQQ